MIFKNKRDLFEKRASQGLTSGYIELLLQPSLGLNPVNPKGYEKLDINICVSQSEQEIQTRPREPCGLEIGLSQDWTRCTRLGQTEQPDGLGQACARGGGGS